MRRAERGGPRRVLTDVSPLRLLLVALALALFFSACDDDEAPAPARQATSEEANPQTPTSEAPTEPRAEPEEPGVVIGVDTHVDTTQRMLDEGDDPFEALEGGHLDVPRMRAGGLHAAFFSIYVRPRDYQGEAAWQRALALIQRVREVAEAHPDAASLCTDAACVRRAASEDRIAMLMGVEGAHALGTEDPDQVLARIRQLHRLGARYMTLTWSVDSPLGHSSTGANPAAGLTPLGVRAVRLMNELGMMIDISHVSDQTFWDALEITTKPVLASHSSARSLADHPRNMSDEMIRAVGQQGGAVCVNYYTQYIDTDYRGRRRAIEFRRQRAFEPLEARYPNWVDRGRAAFALAQELDPDLRPPTLETLGAHFARVVELAGPGGACLGSDFDGVPELPIGMDGVEDLGALRQELERRELPVRPIFGENVLRVLAAQS